MEIREGHLDDLERLVEGNSRLAQETEDLELDLERLTAGVQAVLSGQQPGSYRVLTIDGVVAGQLMLTYEWSDWRNAVVWWIQSVYVWPEHRRQGLYAKLYDSVKAEAEAAGAAGIRLYVDQSNRRAQKVYAQLGMDGGHYQVFEDMAD